MQKMHLVEVSSMYVTMSIDFDSLNAKNVYKK